MNYIQRIYDLLVEAVEINEAEVTKITTTTPFKTEVRRARRGEKPETAMKGRVAQVQHSVKGVKGRYLDKDYIEGQQAGIKAATGKTFKRRPFDERVKNLADRLEARSKKGGKKPETSREMEPFGGVVKRETYSSGKKKGKR